MAPRILIYLTVVLSGVFTDYVSVDCLARFADNSASNVANQIQKLLPSGGQKIVENQAALVPLNYRRVIFYSKPRAMYAGIVKIRAAEGMLALKALSLLDSVPSDHKLS